VLAVALGAGAVFGQGRVFWQEGGVELCAGTCYWGAAAVADGCGGAVVVWFDNRAGSKCVYAQRVSSEGDALWQTDGVPLRADIGSGVTYAAVGDCAGGAIAAWSDWGGIPNCYKVTAQRVDSAGNVRWGPLGTFVTGTTTEDVVYWPALASDERGGAYVAWTHFEIPGCTVAVSRVDSLGGISWTSVLSCDTIENFPPAVCADAQGGIVVVWAAWAGSSWRVMAQRLDSTGTELWAHGGVLVSSQAYGRVAIPSVLVNDDGFVVVWSAQTASGWRVWAQQLDAGGNPMWSDSGCGVSPFYQGLGIWTAVALSGGGGRTICVWEENRDSLYVVTGQSLDSSGRRVWDTTGVVLGPTFSDEGWDFAAVTDARGGAVAAWLVNDGRDWDIRSQRIDTAGRLCWGDSGVWVRNDTLGGQWIPTAVPDGAGGALVAWLGAASVWAQRVGDASSVGELPSGVLSRPLNLSSTPARSHVRITWQDTGVGEKLAVFDGTGRLVARPACDRSGSGIGTAFWDGSTLGGGRAVPGPYFLVLTRADVTAQLARLLWLGN